MVIFKMHNKRKLKSFFIITFVFICFLCGLNQMHTHAEESEDFIVGFDAEFPPYGYMDETGEYIGFDLDLAKEVCKRRGWNFVARPIAWDSKDAELTSGSISCIWNGFTINGREKKYTWSTPYVDNSQVVIVKKGSDIKELADLEGKILAVQSDSSALKALTGEDATKENISLAASLQTLQEVSDYNSAFMNLESGMIDAVAMDIGVASYQLSTKSASFTMLEEQISTEKYGIGFKLGNIELRDEVQDTLFDMLDDGTFEKIATKWGLQDSVCLSHEEATTDTTQSALTVSNSQKEGEDDSKPNSLSTSKPSNEDGKVSALNSGASAKKTDLLKIANLLSNGILSTLAIFTFTLLFSMPLGLIIMALRMSKVRVIQWIAKIYISIMRGTPLMIQLFVVFYAPYYVFGISTPYSYKFYAVIIGFSLNYAAYFAEIYRSGIQSIPVGQREAAKVLGYKQSSTFVRIIFPQMVKRVLPSITNEVITLVKDTSLAFAIGYTEMFTVAKQVASAQTSLIPLFVAGLFYYIFNFVVAFFMELIEKKMDYYK